MYQIAMPEFVVFRTLTLASAAAVTGAKAFTALMGGLALGTGGAAGAVVSALCAIGVGKVAGEAGQELIQRRQLRRRFEEALSLICDDDSMWDWEAVELDALRKMYKRCRPRPRGRDLEGMVAFLAV